ncbi:MAG: hypothetical protein KKC05_03095 [Nanoarchaeota archaeon]|nr:hypothetical protein [Nanoarchaeota archaeon]
MKLIIPLLITLLLAVNVQAICADRIYKVDLFYENQDIYMKSIESVVGCFPSQQNPGYHYEILSDTEETLYAFDFGDPGIIHVDTSVGGMQGEVVTLEVSEFTLLVPEIKDAERIDIYNTEDEKITEIALPEFDIRGFALGQIMRISVFPSSEGFYNEMYIYLDDESKDVVKLNCDYMCYRNMEVAYKIPDSWEQGEYSITVYDYNKRSWRTTNFVVTETAHDAELVIDFR